MQNNKWFDFTTMTSRNERKLGIYYTNKEILSGYFGIMLCLAAGIGAITAEPKTLGFEFALLFGFLGISIIGNIIQSARNRRIKELMNGK